MHTRTAYIVNGVPTIEGAQPTDTVRRLLAKALIIDASQVPERQYTVIEKKEVEEEAKEDDDGGAEGGDASEDADA